MAIPEGGEIGGGVHEGHDQLLSFVAGSGVAKIGQTEREMADGDVSIVPPGVFHNFRNTGSRMLKIFTTYSPPEHEPETELPPKRTRTSEPGKVDIGAVGASTAGLPALRKVRPYTDGLLFVNDGRWGSTCTVVEGIYPWRRSRWRTPLTGAAPSESSASGAPTRCTRTFPRYSRGAPDERPFGEGTEIGARQAGRPRRFGPRAPLAGGPALNEGMVETRRGILLASGSAWPVARRRRFDVLQSPPE